MIEWHALSDILRAVTVHPCSPYMNPRRIDGLWCTICTMLVWTESSSTLVFPQRKIVVVRCNVVWWQWRNYQVPKLIFNCYCSEDAFSPVLPVLCCACDTHLVVLLSAILIISQSRYKRLGQWFHQFLLLLSNNKLYSLQLEYKVIIVAVLVYAQASRNDTQYTKQCDWTT